MVPSLNEFWASFFKIGLAEAYPTNSKPVKIEIRIFITRENPTPPSGFREVQRINRGDNCVIR